ncbi:5-hydroxytryptamine receptor 1E-like [Clytia hemisphaerica]|uniref:5-hydroxytryptamine receptor 1E-like n=1 Tax=Clytia hemisphaerica TaxID=252671 RepID=UPI0034D473B2
MVFALAGGATPEFRCHGNSYLMKGLISIPIVFLGILANFVVILVGWQQWKIYTACQKLITALAGFDLFFAVMKLIVSVPLLWTCQWVYGNFGCKTFGSVLGASSSISIGLILLISIERYIGITNPFARGLSQSHLLLGYLVTIITAFILMVPYTLNVHMSSTTLQCVDDWGDPSFPLVYYWMLLLIAFLVPITVLLVINYKIIKVVNKSLHFLGYHDNAKEMTSSQGFQMTSLQERQVTSLQERKVTSSQERKVTSSQKRKVTSSQERKVTSSQERKETSSQERQATSSQERQIRRRHHENKRISRILASLLLAFVMFVLPNKMYWLLKYHGSLRDLDVTEMNILINILNVCYSIHVSVNPLIYSIIDVRFRKHFKEMFLCKEYTC